MLSAHVSVPYVIAGSTHEMSFHACPNVTIEDVAMLSQCYPSGHDSSLNLIVLFFVPGTVSMSQIDVAFNVLDLGVVDIYCMVCRFPSSPLSSTCSSSDPDFQFH